MSDQEHDSASQLGKAVDALLEGHDSGADDPALVAARRIRASLHPPALPAERKTALASTVAGQWAWRRRRRTVTAVLAVAAVLVLVVLASLLFRRGDSLPEHLRSRETATLIPGPFPPEQSASDRIDLIYSDRMGSFRELSLRDEDRPRPRRAEPQPHTASVAEVTP